MRADGVEERGGDDLVASVLDAARRQLGLEVGYFSEFVDGRQVIRGVVGGEAIGIAEGDASPLADTFCRRVVDGTVANVVPDVLAEPALADLVADGHPLGAYVGVPLALPGGRLYGTLCAAGPTARPELGPRDVAFLRVLAGLLAEHLALAAERAAWSARLERANTELAEFAHVVAHDLTEPMRTVSGLVQLMARRHGDVLGDEVDLVVAEARRMETLVDDLLHLARAGGAAERLPTDLARVADDVLAALRGAIEAAGATVHVGPLPTVPGVAAQLHQVLQNLVANALKFRGEAPPTIAITAERRDDVWVVAVTDDGPGVDPVDRERIFTAFARGRAGRGRPGTGIGLAVCAKVVAAHGGELTVEPAPGGGSRFAFTLPG